MEKPGVLDRFLREIRAVARLRHPNIVAAYSALRLGESVVFAMEYVDGLDLRALLRRDGRLEPERAVAIVEQVAGALDTAHAEGLVHRDVKPGNILVRSDADGEHAFICDFGLARHVASVSSLTGDRGFVGTIDYVPPEQIEGGSIDARADVYSLGCVLFECLAGVRPFERDSELSVVFAHLNEPPPALTDARPELPAAFDVVFATALAKDPDARYQSCGELARAARAALHGEVRRRRRSRRRLVAAGLVAAAATVTGIALTQHGHAALPVTITPNELAGVRLGDSNVAIERMWGGGQKLSMQTPPDYSVLTDHSRNLSAYFAGTADKVVEVTTWNSADRTAEGIGPCSTVADLKKAYGSRLKASPHNTHDGVVFGWMLDKHLFFATGPSPVPTTVTAVALYDNDVSWAGFNALNEAPCSRAVDATRVKRPVQVPKAVAPPLPTVLSSRLFRPDVVVRAPRGWSALEDTARTFGIRSPNGTSMRFFLDPRAAAAGGRALPGVSGTPRRLTKWLEGAAGLTVTAPQTILFGRPLLTKDSVGELTATSVDVRRRAGAATPLLYFAFAGSGRATALRSSPGRPTRLYLAPIRIGTLVHTLAIVVEGPSERAFTSALPAAAAIVKNVKVSAVATLNLSALSGFCVGVFQGTCRGELDPGTYSSTSLRPRLTYTVPVGWTNFTDHPGVFGLVPPGGDFSAVESGKSDYVDVFTSIATAKDGCPDGNGAARTPEAFVRRLRRRPGVEMSKPAAVTVGGLSGVVVDLRIAKSWTGTCPWSNGLPAEQILTGLPPSPPELNHSLLPQPMVMRLYLLHYHRGTLGIEIDEVSGSSKLRAYSDVVKSFRFGN